jgi:hypothetical protein
MEGAAKPLPIDVDRSVLLKIVSSGVLAPSADNRPSLRFRIAESAIEVVFAGQGPARVEPHQHVLRVLGLGAAIENMLVGASAFGLSARLQYFPSAESGLAARLDFTHNAHAGEDPLHKAIATRHTNRRMYQRAPVSAEERSALYTAARSVDGVDLLWLEGVHRRQALGLIWLAESERFLRASLHHELYSSIRFDLGWEESTDDGLPPSALEVEAFARPLFKALRRWPLMRALNVVGAHRMLGLRAGLIPCLQAGALGVITTRLPLPEGALAAGRGLERLWLKASLLGLALQPMAASAVLPLQAPCPRPAAEQVRKKLSLRWKRIAPRATPLMVVRMGHAAAPSGRAMRGPVERYLLADRQG